MALCAYIRCILMACCLCWRCRVGGHGYDVVIVDQVSVAVIVLRMFMTSKIVFYCHFPDLLLSKPASALHRAYRAPLNALEEWSTGLAHRTLVNSEYTKSIFKETFRSLDGRGIVPDVLYPAVSIPSSLSLKQMGTSWMNHLPKDVVRLIESSSDTFLSINRFERKKNIGLAIRALGLVRGGSSGLVVAGGYDVRLAENVEHLEELKKLVKELHLEDRVVFMTSFSDEQRLALLCACRAVVYTPTNEHFGIVPVEAMASNTPVIACNSGGPMESIVTGKTGFLEDSDPSAFAKAMEACMDAQAAQRMGTLARTRAEKYFSRTAFGDQLETIVVEMARAVKGKPGKKYA
mmetsp:Transcript_4600/g.9196  ORF Transcript_4600/g.9196 Transcript_4600/m.9196 type:complete len:348 (-) Transcript_4600:108-1151(-)